MYRSYDAENGIPPRIYRTPSEIRDDIKGISRLIKETVSMLNIRELLLNILMSERKDSPESLIPELEAAISEAKEAYSRLEDLREELNLLEEELKEAKWLIRG